MALNFSQRLLDILVENSLSILREHAGLARAEGAFFEVIDLIREDPRLKTYFLEKVEKTLLSNGMGQLAIGEVPRELIELAVFEFKWPEFAELARRTQAAGSRACRRSAVCGTV